MEEEHIEGWITDYKRFKIYWRTIKKIPEKDVKKGYLFSANKGQHSGISIILYEVSSTPQDISVKEIKKIGLKKVKEIIDREKDNFEILLTKDILT